MKITTLNDRIQKAEETIEKKNNTIVKKTALIQKKAKALEKMGVNVDDIEATVHNRLEYTDNKDAYWTLCDICSLMDDIKRGNREIEEKKKALEGYKAQLSGEIEKESLFVKELPTFLNDMRDELVERWDRYDIERRDWLREEYTKLGYNEFFKKHRRSDYEYRYLTDEQIHDENVEAAKVLVLNFYNRVKDITGEITSWDGIHATTGACGMTVLNGYVEGKQGRAEVESILAGGYNIQRLHVRVLVKEYN